MSDKEYYSFEEVLKDLKLEENELKRLVSAGEIRIEIALEPLAQPELDLVGGLVGKGQSHDLGDLQWVGVARQQVQEPVDEQGRFSRPRAGGDHDVAVEGGDGALAVGGVAEGNFFWARAHSFFKSLPRSSRCGAVAGSFSARHRLGG